MSRIHFRIWLSVVFSVLAVASSASAEDWLQLRYDGRRSGNVPQRSLKTPLGLIGAVPLSDAILTSPVIADGQIYAVDASGTAFCIDASTLKVLWQFQSGGGKGNCNNVSSPALVGGRLHFGTIAGSYYVLNAKDGSVVKEIRCGEPILSAPVVSDDRAYFATLGARVYAVDADGGVQWTWDFVKEVLKFNGDRWSGADWTKHKNGRVTWEDHFVCSRDIGMFGKTVVIPAGGRTIFLEDAGSRPEVRTIGLIPNYAGSEYPACLGQTIGEQGEVYTQWHRRDNAGRVEILKLIPPLNPPLQKGGKGGWEIQADFVKGTQTAISLHGLLSFAGVSVRGKDVYRCRPEEGFGFCKHAPGETTPQYLGGFPSITSPILSGDAGVYGGLDGSLYVVPLSPPLSPPLAKGGTGGWSFKTAFGKAISSSVAVSDGRVYFGCEDGYLYVLGPNGKAPLPTAKLPIEKIRSPLTGKYADAKFDWFTNYGDQACTNASLQSVELPVKISWMRRYEGTVKHLPVCGGGRMYTHTAEGQIFAIEQETGRHLWRRYFPGVYLSFTSPIYYSSPPLQKGGAGGVKERLLIPQAGMDESRVRCLDAATGELLWESPFTGSPSWSRQGPPIVHGNLAIYASGSGQYAAQGTEKAFIMGGKPVPSPAGKEIMSWIYTHNNPYYPKDNRPLIWAWDLDTGKEVWKKDFSDLGSGGNDCGLCLLDGKVYYSTFFGYAESVRKRRGLPAGPNGFTAALDPKTGNILWKTDKYYVTAGCTLSGKNGRLYLGGYNQPHEGTNDRHIWCLDAKDGSLIWQSDPVKSAVNVVTVGDKFLFSNAIRGDGHVIDLATGKIVSRFNNSYNCTRFTLSGQLLLGANLDIVDLTTNKLVSTGPAVDSRECLGAVLSNGRVFYISQASAMQVSQVCGEEAKAFVAPWERRR